MKYVVFVCLLTVATLAYVQARLIPLQSDVVEALRRDIQAYYDMMSRFRGSSTVVERINTAFADSEEPLDVLVNADLRSNDSVKTCDLTIRYQDMSKQFFRISDIECLN